MLGFIKAKLEFVSLDRASLTNWIKNGKIKPTVAYPFVSK